MENLKREYEKVYIFSASRTPIGAFNGVLSALPAHKLGAVVIKAALSSTTFKPEDVSEVIMGQVLTAGQGQNPARQASLEAGIPESVPAYGINMLCGSGLKAVCMGYQAICNGDSELVICGGQESMSQAHHSAHLRSACRMGPKQFQDTVIIDGLTDAMLNIHMGLTAENLAKKFNVPKNVQDEYALGSLEKAHTAVKNGLFKEEIVPVEIAVRNKPSQKVDTDECKILYTGAALAEMKPAFLKDGSGSVTGGNASSINDGAAALVLGGETQLKATGNTALAEIIGWSQVGVSPIDMGIGPVKAVKALMAKLNWTDDNVDLYELNEAFSVQAVCVVNELKIDVSKVNVAGGAVALGHPIGASGARILVTLLHHMRRLDKNTGIAALCVGGGLGIAIAVDRTLLKSP